MLWIQELEACYKTFQPVKGSWVSYSIHLLLPFQWALPIITCLMLHEKHATFIVLVAPITKVRLTFRGFLFWSSKLSKGPLCQIALNSWSCRYADAICLYCPSQVPSLSSICIPWCTFLPCENLLIKNKISWKLGSQYTCLTYVAILICCTDDCLSASRIDLQVFHDPMASWIAICLCSQSWVLLHNSLHSCWLWWVLNASASAWHSSHSSIRRGKILKVSAIKLACKPWTGM